MVPLLDLKRQYETIKHEIEPLVREICESQYFILGPEVSKMEEAMCAFNGCKHALGVSSGTDALLVAMMALDLKPGDEVITVPFTFFATVGTMDRIGVKPVFVDIDPVTYNMDPSQLKAAITEKTKAIVPVHLFGQCADMDPIMEIACEHNLPVLEDAAQAIGSEYLQEIGPEAPVARKAGTMGLMGCFSFFPSKNLGAFGDGGLVVTNDDELYHKLVALRMHGAHRTYLHEMVGGNFRIDALQAAVVGAKLPYLDEWSRGRARNACRYLGMFEEAGLLEHFSPPALDPAARAKKAKHPDATVNFPHIYNQFTLRVPEKRNALRERLNAKGIGNSVYYPLPLHMQPCFQHLGHKEGEFPVSERAAQEVVSLPVFPELTEAEQAEVVTALKEFFQ